MVDQGVGDEVVTEWTSLDVIGAPGDLGWLDALGAPGVLGGLVRSVAPGNAMHAVVLQVGQQRHERKQRQSE